MWSLIFGQTKPEVNGWSGFPRIVSLPWESIDTANEQASGQSFVQTVISAIISITPSDRIKTRFGVTLRSGTVDNYTY